MPKATAASVPCTLDKTHAGATEEKAERPVPYAYEGSAERLAALMHLAQNPEGCTAVELLLAIANTTGRTLIDQQLADLLASMRADKRVASESLPNPPKGKNAAKRWYSPAARQAAQVRRDAAALAANRGGTGAGTQAD